MGLCGELYIDETQIKVFSAIITIEAGFYSGDLIEYLVEAFQMPTRNIKWEITTKKALKQETFRDYIKYPFDTFSEAEAKTLSNSFIGELGRKYTRTNRGFTCRDIDTVQCSWTVGLAERKNITINNYNDLFLIREQTVERFFSDNTSVNRFVVSKAIFRCLYHLYDNWANETKLYSINTDGFFITNPRKQHPSKKDVKF